MNTYFASPDVTVFFEDENSEDGLIVTKSSETLESSSGDFCIEQNEHIIISNITGRFDINATMSREKYQKICGLTRIEGV